MNTQQEMTEDNQLTQTTWINTMYDYATPKKWVALPLIDEKEFGMVVIDCHGDKICVATSKEESNA